MKLKDIFAASASALAVLAAKPAMATILYNSDNVTNGFDATAIGSLPAGWTNVSGTWEVNTGASTLTNHTHTFYDTTQTQGTLAVYTDMTATVDMEVVATQEITVSGGLFSSITLGVRGDSTANNGYYVILSEVSGQYEADIYEKVSGTPTRIFTVGNPGNLIGNMPAPASGQHVTIRFGIIGSNLYLRLGTNGSNETNLAYTVSNSDIMAAGYAFVRNYQGVAGQSASVTDLTVNDYPYDEAQGLQVLTPQPSISGGQPVTVRFHGTPPTSINYAMDGAPTYTAASCVNVGASSLTFVVPSSSAGWHQITVQNGGLTQAVSASGPYDYTGGSAGLGAGPLSLTPTNTSITINPLCAYGGSGSGYSYSIYRGTVPDFAESAGTLLATTSALPYVDTTAAAGTQYYYGVHVTDSANNSVDAMPAGYGMPTSGGPFYVSAALYGQPYNIVFIGDSITESYPNSSQDTELPNSGVYWTTFMLQHGWGTRAVVAKNAGVGGSQTADWLPGQTDYQNAVPAAASYAATLHANNPSYQMMFTIQLGANDAYALNVTSTYAENLTSIVDGIFAEWPNAIVFIHEPFWFSDNRSTVGSTGLALIPQYDALIPGLVATLSAAHGGKVHLGNTVGYNYFATTYETSINSQNPTSFGGNYFLHPNDTGQEAMGEMQAIAIGNTLFGSGGASPTLTFRDGFFH